MTTAYAFLPTLPGMPALRKTNNLIPGILSGSLNSPTYLFKWSYLIGWHLVAVTIHQSAIIEFLALFKSPFLACPIIIINHHSVCIQCSSVNDPALQEGSVLSYFPLVKLGGL